MVAYGGRDHPSLPAARNEMDQFVSHHVPCPDAKGRVSVRASLRAGLARYGVVGGLYCHAFKTALGAWSAARSHGARQ
jgi:hypothetical protein